MRYCSDRKEEKDHGADKGKFLGSSLQDGDRVIMIEDVTTSGKSIEETFPILKSQADVEIKGLMVSLNRMERGKGEKCALDEIKELYGFPTAAIVSRWQLPAGFPCKPVQTGHRNPDHSCHESPLRNTRPDGAAAYRLHMHPRS